MNGRTSCKDMAVVGVGARLPGAEHATRDGAVACAILLRIEEAVLLANNQPQELQVENRVGVLLAARSVVDSAPA